MSIANELVKTQGYLSEAYDAVEDMGGTLPANKNLANLSGAISALPTGNSLVELLESRTNLTYALAYSGITECPMFTVNSSVTSFNYMFNYCSQLTTVPQLDTSRGKTFNYMFQNCSSLTTIPLLDLSSCTNLTSIFSGCSSLTTIPLFPTNTDASVNFACTGMFQNCSSLTTIPLLDLSRGSGFQQTFQNCTNLISIPQLDTSNSTTFVSTFRGCTNLTTVPQLSFVKAGAPLANALQNTFVDCPSLTSQSLNNILASLAGSRVTTSSYQTLKYVGLSETQATTCTGLSNWAACQAAGWTTGY